ncbi:MAG: DNA-directed RNA polymerase [Candidatus Aenigmatarchaeota archaeon]
MYRILTVQDRIRVPPEKMGMKLRDAIKESIAEKFEGTLDPKVGVILAVVSVDEIGEGKILPMDPGVHYLTKFKILVYKPELHEMVYGEIIDNTEFGSFVRIGPLDGLVHISQIMDDFVSYDNKNSVFIGKEKRRTLREGDKVRARIISISYAEQQKIGLTMRQPGLGSLVWLEEEKKKKKK